VGNLLIQAIALGQVRSLSAAREVVRHSSAIETVEPQHTAAWHSAYTRMEGLLHQS